MNENSFNTEVHGGTVAIASAQQVHIENFTQYAPAPPPAPAPAPQASPIPACPYPGLAYFGPQDASRFFGRERAIQALVTAVGKSSFTALVGASGSGKSSVVLAGLAPRLDAQGEWRSTYFRIGLETDKNPFAALVRALEPLTGDRGLADQLEEVQKVAGKLAEGSVSLLNVIATCRTKNPRKRILLIADQFEEAFTLVPDDALRERFINALIEAFPDPPHGSTPDVCLVLTLRADFYNAALRYRPLADRLQDHVENLGPMTRDELREAIVKPAEQLDPSVTFEPGLAGTILDDVERRPGSLPLLQFALREMWGHLKTPLMTRTDYDKIGGVEGALANRAQAIFEDATKKETDAASVALFRQLFTRLVTLGEGAEDTRRIVAREELGEQEWTLAQRLADEDNRLVVTAATTPGQETVEVVHEALIRNWPALVDWVNRDRAFISWRNQLKQRLDDWRKLPSDEGTLLRGGPLAVAEEWIALRWNDLNTEERGFVAKSIELRDAEKRRTEEERRDKEERLDQLFTELKARLRAQRRVRWALATIAAVIVAAAGLFYWQYSSDAHKLKSGQGRLAEAQTTLSLQQRQLDAAQTALDTNKEALHQQEAAAVKLQRTLDTRQSELGAKQLELQHQHANLLGELANTQLARRKTDAALRFAAKGAEDDLGVGSQSGTALPSMAALAASVSSSDWRLGFRVGGEGVRAAAFSPDGTRIVTASNDKTARVWNAATAKQIAVLRGHEGFVTSVAFSRDGRRIVTASWDKTARVWDAATAKQIAVLRGHGYWVTSAAFSPDGTRIVTASSDKTARVWNVAAAREVAVLRGHEGAVNSAAFSPDGRRIVTASSDDTARVWNTLTAKQDAVLRGHEGAVNSAAFSADGRRIVTASSDDTVRVWNASTAKQDTVLRGHEGAVNSAAFSPDGTRIVTASSDKTARVWDAAAAKEVAVLRGHEGAVNSSAFSPGGSRIVTASWDKTARVWDAATAKEIVVLRGHDAEVTSAAFSPDGTRIVTASWDATARVWDAAAAKEVAVLRGHEGAVVYSAAFSPDGTRIVTASDDKTARVWDAATAKQIAVLRGHEAEVSSAAFSPDGMRIVTASSDNTARVWDAATSKEIVVLRGHDNWVHSAAFSRDGSRIVTASWDKTARVWDAATAKEIVVLRGHDAEVTSAAFSPDGTRIVTASWDATARVWDAAAAKEVAVLRGHEGAVNSAAFSSDGRRIVTTSADNTARVWDAATAKEIVVLRGHDAEVSSAAFNPDRTRIVTASRDKTARIWDAYFMTMPAEGLLAEVCQHRMIGFSAWSRDEMRLAGYPDSEPLLDVCAGVAEARP